MLLLPAIDLRGGRCVRLLRGSFSDVTRYSEDPVATAASFADAGARWVHIVDLDAAEGKGADNTAVIERIRRAIPCRMEVGGGVRSAEAARRLLDLGVDRVVVGTALVRHPQEVSSWVRALGPRFAAGVDARDGEVKVGGWTEGTSRSDVDVAAGIAGLGMCWLVYTNISRDGTLGGPDIERTNAAARAASVPTILSGGIGSERDVDQVAEKAGPLIAGVILGKAVYESRVDLGALFRRYPQASGGAWENPGSC
jgi:phosphoribosylformimino-5-aminoimidazole carboxamide ribotide isomerase